MKTGTAFVLTCAVAGAFGPAARAAEPVSLKATAIEMARVTPVAFEMMQRELQILLEPSGVRLSWRRAHASAETARDELLVVFLDGAARGTLAGSGVLAAARSADPAPTIWVYMPTVVESLGPAGQELDSLGARRALGLALGRVLAHELIHVLAPEIPHGHGVMAERFRLVALGQTRPELSPLLARALEHGAQVWVARGRRGTSVAGGMSPAGFGVSLTRDAP